MIIECRVRPKHRVTTSHHRGSGFGADRGGWTWTADCLCGWRSFQRVEEDGLTAPIEEHLTLEQVLLDQFEARGSVTVSYWDFLYIRLGKIDPDRRYWTRPTILQRWKVEV